MPVELFRRKFGMLRHPTLEGPPETSVKGVLVCRVEPRLKVCIAYWTLLLLLTMLTSLPFVDISLPLDLVSFSIGQR
jgi:hypothetical protein